MTNYEIITLGLSICTLAVAYVAYVNATKIKEIDESMSNKMLDIETNNLKQNMAQTELYIQELLVNARTLFININLEIIKLSIDGNEELTKIRDNLTQMSLQEILNAYEVACMKYLDEKIDTERFQKTYSQEVRQIFENPSYTPLLSKTNSFHALKKVNDKWHNPERY